MTRPPPHSASSSLARAMGRPATHRLLILLLLVLVVLGVSPVAAAPVAQASPITLSARSAYEGVYRVGNWLPVLVELENSGVDRTVEVRVGSREGAQYSAEVELPNNGRKTLTIYVYLATAVRRLQVRLLNGDEELANQTLQLQPANLRARLVGVLAGAGGALRPPARLDDGTPLVVVPLGLADLPDHPLGLSSLATLVIEDVATSELSERQREALNEWVLRGGQLIIGGGAGLARTLDGLAPELRTVNLVGEATLPAATLLGAEAATATALPLARLEPRPDLAGRSPYRVPVAMLSGEAPVFEQTLGRGVITALSLPLAHPALASWSQFAQLWQALLRPVSELPPGFAPENVTFDGFTEGNLASTLTSLPALEFPPLALLGGLLLAYIVIVGPLTYLVLRRLDRQMLGWVVVPVLTLVFAGLTYGLGYTQRGGDLVLNQVTLIEPLEGADGRARVRSFVGVFSPERRAYTLQAELLGASGEPLLRPISVQGPWDTSGSSMGGVYVQDGRSEARNFEIAQWSMRALASDTITPASSVKAQLRIEGQKLSGTVQNDSTMLLRDVALVQGNWVARLGDIPAGETRSGALTRRQQGQMGMGGSSVPVSYAIYGEEMDNQSKMGGQPLPPELQLRVRLLDALYNYGPSTHSGQPLMVAWADSAGLALRTGEQRADEQQVAIVATTPSIEMVGASIDLPQGWFSPRFEGNQVNACFGGQGAGLTLGTEPGVMQLSLPRDLYGVQASALTLLGSSDGPWSEDIRLELYNWAEGSWVEQSTVRRTLEVADASSFLGTHGKLRIRLSATGPLMNTGCVYVDAKLKGTMP